MTELTPEDALRLNVLLARRPQAIRIHEAELVVCGLSEEGESRLQLHPNCRAEQYLRLVRETLSGHVLGSPGGYPVYLKRWTRMGQMRDESLEQLLQLGEPEAVAAVVHAPGLTEELARRAWWALPTAEHARSMLQRPAVRQGQMGKVLADYLVEHLPFENQSAVIVDTVRLLLSPGLLPEAARTALWRQQGRHQDARQVGFLLAVPDALPEPLGPRRDAEACAHRLGPWAAAGNPFARQLLRVFSGSGQTFLQTVAEVLRRPADQEVVLGLFEAVAGYFESVRLGEKAEADLDTVLAETEEFCAGNRGAEAQGPRALRDLLAGLPDLAAEVRAMLLLARLGYPLVRPIFSRSTAVGTLMRRKLQPVTDPVLAAIGTLRGPQG